MKAFVAIVLLILAAMAEATHHARKINLRDEANEGVYDFVNSNGDKCTCAVPAPNPPSQVKVPPTTAPPSPPIVQSHKQTVVVPSQEDCGYPYYRRVDDIEV